jgi:hypothetical protein
MAKTQLDTLTEAVTALVRDQNDRPPRDVTVNELKAKTPWNPTGERRTKKYAKFYQNGALLDHDKMTQEELDLFSQIRPGRYHGRAWEVIRRRDKSLDLRYRNAQLSDRMELKGIAPNLVTMLQQILTEQEAQAERRKRGEYDDEND